MTDKPPRIIQPVKDNCLWDIDCYSAIVVDMNVCCMELTVTDNTNLQTADVVNDFPTAKDGKERFCAKSSFVTKVDGNGGTYEEAGVKYSAKCIGWNGTEALGSTYLQTSAFMSMAMLYIASF